MIYFLLFLILILFNSYIIYPIILKKKTEKNVKIISDSDKKSYKFSIIIPFVKETESLDKKIQNLLDLDYNKEKIEIIVVQDNPEKIEISNKNFKHIVLSKKYGKSIAVLIGALNAKNNYLVLTDVNSLFEKQYFNKLNNIINKKPDYIIGGFLKYNNSKIEDNYWRWELNQKKMENNSDFLILGLLGSNIIIRKDIFLTYPYYNLCDFSLPIMYQLNGGKVYFSDELIVEEEDYSDLKTLIKTKYRIIKRAMYGLYKIYKIKKDKSIEYKFLYQLLSHKIIRWFTPYLLLMIFALSLVIFGTLKSILFYTILLILSYIFYRKKLIYIISVNISAFFAIIVFILKIHTNRWEPTNVNKK